MRMPESHADILEGPVTAVLSTVEPGGGLRSSPCVCRGGGDGLLVTSVDPVQARQIMLNSKVSVLVVDPANVDRWLCVQGDAAPRRGEWGLSIRHVRVFPALK